MFRAVLVAIAGLAAAAVQVVPAEAGSRIACRGDFQVVQGSEIATPYCQDNNVARVAREYGVRVTDETVRNNPIRKREICSLIGQDIRVQTACSEPSRGRRGY